MGGSADLLPVTAMASSRNTAVPEDLNVTPILSCIAMVSHPASPDLNADSAMVSRMELERFLWQQVELSLQDGSVCRQSVETALLASLSATQE